MGQVALICSLRRQLRDLSARSLLTIHSRGTESTLESAALVVITSACIVGSPMKHEEFTRCLAERTEVVPIEKSKDQDRGKGAVEQDQTNEGGNTSLSGQLGHRDEDAELKNADSDLSG